MNKKLTRILAFICMLVLVASLAAPAFAAGCYSKNGWFITTGDSLFTKKSTVSFKNTTKGEYLIITFKNVSGCTWEYAGGANPIGGYKSNVFKVAPGSTGKITISTKLGNSGCIDYNLRGSNGGYVTYSISTSKVTAYN